MAKILLAEDEKNVSLLYQTELEAEGHEVLVAYDGIAAIEAARENRPDLVIVDIRLDNQMDGLELLSRLLAENKALPVIINTGYSQYRDNFMTWGAEAYVLKSADLGPLKKAIANALQREQVQPTVPDRRVGLAPSEQTPASA
jgi:DNA-binding response OmpR family regulator